MKIVLCCAGGFSTTMLMDSMKAIVKKSADRRLCINWTSSSQLLNHTIFHM